MGYIRVPNNLFDLSLSGREFKVFLVLSAKGFHSGRRYFSLSLQEISRHSGLSVATVKRSLDELEQRGILLRCQTYIHGKRAANRYRLCFGKRDLQTGYFVLDLDAVRNYCPEKLLTYACLVRHLNALGITYVSERQIAKETGLSRTTVRKYTEILSSEGALNKYARYYRKHRQTQARRSFSYYIRRDLTVEEFCEEFAFPEQILFPSIRRDIPPPDRRSARTVAAHRKRKISHEAPMRSPP